MQSDDFVVKYDLLHWDITEEMAGIDRISKFEKFIQSLEECGARVEIYKGNELVSKLLRKQYAYAKGDCR